MDRVKRREDDEGVASIEMCALAVRDPRSGLPRECPLDTASKTPVGDASSDVFTVTTTPETRLEPSADGFELVAVSLVKVLLFDLVSRPSGAQTYRVCVRSTYKALSPVEVPPVESSADEACEVSKMSS